MNLLTANTALNPGSDLWVMPDQNHSKWNLKIDYYLNFIILKNLRHSSAHLSNNLNMILQKTEALEGHNLNFQKKDSGILIFSENHLPNKWVYYLPYSGSLKTWIQELLKCWQGLNNPSLRLFLPAGLEAIDFEKEWQDQTEFSNLTFVLDFTTERGL